MRIRGSLRVVLNTSPVIVLVKLRVLENDALNLNYASRITIINE